MSQRFRAYLKDSKFGLVIVTGGSSGIGKSILETIRKLEPEALQYNLSRQKPDSFYNDHNSRHLECDLANPSQRKGVFETLLNEITSVAPGFPILLVNNAGYGSYGPIGSVDARRELDLVEVNLSAVVELTSILLPALRERGGAVVNIASVTAFGPVPGMATYAAAKGFIVSWTVALSEELRGSKARAIVVCPGPTQTGFHERAGDREPHFPTGISSPEEIAQRIVKALSNRSVIVTPGFPNRVAALLAATLPKSLVARISRFVLKRSRPSAAL